MQQSEIDKELSRIEEAAMWSAQGQFEQSKTWRAVHLGLAAPAALLAAVTGGTLLADEISAGVGGIAALVSAAFAGLATALGASEKSSHCQTVGNRYLALQAAARRAREIDLPNQDFPDARAQLTELADLHDEINDAAPVISKRSYKRARKNIETEGGQTYRADSRG